MVQLDDAHINFTQIDDYELFLLLFESLKMMKTSVLFGDVDFSTMKIAKSEATGEFVVVDDDRRAVIDRVIHTKICGCLRNMLHIEKSDKKPGNEEARKYLIDRERKRQNRAKNKPKDSQLEKYIIALVNTEQFPYNYETVRDISIYQFYASLSQITHKIKYDSIMAGYFAGNIKYEDLTPADRTWIQNVQ